MLKRGMIAVLLAGVALLGLIGCDGGSPSLNPSITLKFPDNTTLPNLASGAIFLIDGTAAVADDKTNPIISYRWVQTPAVGTFSSTTTFTTTWAAPVIPTVANGGTPQKVTLTLTTETLLGGKTVTPLVVIVQPSL